MMAAPRLTNRRKVPTRENIFGWGKPAPVAVKRRGRTGGLSLTEASSAALKAGRTSGDLSDFDSWLERKHLDTRSDAVISRIRDAYSRGVDKSDADEENRQFIKDKREQAREAARDERAAAGRGRKSKAAAASPYASMPDEATLEAGFKRGLSLTDMLRANPSLRALRKSNPAKFDRCVKAVQAKGGAGNAYAVCTAAGTRGNPDVWRSEYTADTKEHAEMNRRQIAREGYRVYAVKKVGDRWGFYYDVDRKRNPAAAAAEVYEEFHGFPPDELVTVSRKRHYHKHVAAAGDLVGLQVKPINKGQVRTIEGLGECFLAFNEAKNQLFIEGGDQRMSPAELKKFGVTDEHELQTLGKLVGVGYFTNKKHLGKEGGEAVYSHTFRGINENGKHVIVTIARDPDLIYRVLDEQFEVSGGSYEILREGINK